ncbi:MAG: PD-(D/E)XK nuclease family protein [Thermoleophilaceae bacterium]|nr:PD-(D/E)XK nuclease family protein [Thermoleophilaceae bacterium]
MPSFRDVEHVQRELAERGAVLGAGVLRFARLFELIAQRAGHAARRTSRLQRELIVEEAVRRAGLSALADSAERPGFTRAAARLVAELGRSMVEPQRLVQALRAWAGDGPRRQYAEEVGAIYARYRDVLAELGMVDEELFAWRALDALRREPARWGRSPVFVYGFDDFTPLELDALETLSRHAGVDVSVSLPYEPGRAAFRAIARPREELAALADEPPRELPATSDHYAPASRAALHHLERSLFEDGRGRRPSPCGAVRLLRAGGERAEVELVAAEVLELLRTGTPPGDVAVVFREPARYGTLVEQVFRSYGIPFALERDVSFAHTGLGRGFLALIRVALLGGDAADLLAYLRTPGLLERPRLADLLEREVRVAGTESAERARELWEERRWRLEEIDRIRAAEREGAVPLLDRLDTELERVFAAPYRRRAHLFAPDELDGPRAWRAAAAAIAELRELAAAGVAVDARRVHDVLARLPVRVGEPPQPDRVQVASPAEVRARRFEAVFVCGLQEGEFPRPAPAEPFLPDEERRAIALSAGLVLPMREDELARERYLFYVCASRAERLLVLSSRTSDEEGDPEAPSFFLEDVKGLFDSSLEDRARTRSLSDVTWGPLEAPTETEWRRALAAAGPRRPEPRPDGLRAPEVLARLGEGRVWSASALEAFADCPVKWLVDRLLSPQALEPDAEQLVRGSYAHDVLELTYRRLREATGERRVTRASLATAERILREALAERERLFPISPKETRVRAAVRRLEFDLLRHLRREADYDGRFEPEHLELEFGSLELADGVAVGGKIDRVDTWEGRALVRDYKSGSTATPVARWQEDRRLQAALYMLAVRRMLGLEPAGGVYVPLAGKEPRPRGLLAAELREELGSGFAENDFLPQEEFEAVLDQAERTVVELVAQIRRGELRPCPATCGWRGEGCTYPALCREES